MHHADLASLWTSVVADFRVGVRTDRHDDLVGALRPVELRGDELVLDVPSHARGWIRERLLRALEVSAARVVGRHVRIRLQGPGGRPGGAGHTGSRDRTPPPPTPPPDRPLNPRYRFDSLVLGEANRLAHAGALAVAEAPGAAYNPLFLCGPPGLGKTHLLHAIGHFVTAHQPGARVRLTTGEAFVTEFTGALRNQGIDAFKRRHRQTDLLLVDDVQFLMAKTRTEEEFFHTFNALHDAGAQLVLTCDRTPAELGEMMARLRERFAAGLVAEIGPPDHAMRLTILRKQAAQANIVPEDPQLFDAIARRVTGSARAVEAAFVRVVAYASLVQAPLTRDTADVALAALLGDRSAARVPGSRPGRPASPAPTVDDVLAAAARTFGVEVEALLGRATDRRTVHARRVAMFVAREETGDSYPVLGKAFGRNHTTVLGAVRGIEARLSTDEALRLDLDRVRGALHDGPQAGGSLCADA